MQQYLQLMRHIRENGVFKSDRTGTGTYSVFGHQMRFNLADGFPLVTTKKVHLKSIIHELLWFLKGDTNVAYLQENGVSIWNEWVTDKDIIESVAVSDDERYTIFCRRHSGGDEEAAGWHFRRYLIRKLIIDGKLLDVDAVSKHIVFNSSSDTLLRQYPAECAAVLDENGIQREKEVIVKKKGELGPVYGYQWRSWPTPDGQHIDQISQVIQQLKNNPDSRRIIVSAWNVADIEKMALPPCHAFFQFYVADGKLSCQLYQRSADFFIGVPFNIASYALLTMMVAQVCGLGLGEFIWTGGDCHLYSNHLEQADLQLSREPMPLPTMQINANVKDIFGFTYDDFQLIGYESHPGIKAPVAV